MSGECYDNYNPNYNFGAYTPPNTYVPDYQPTPTTSQADQDSAQASLDLMPYNQSINRSNQQQSPAQSNYNYGTEPDENPYQAAAPAPAPAQEPSMNDAGIEQGFPVGYYV